MADDDPTIDDETSLYRRLHSTQIVWDDNRGRLRPTSNAFKDPNLSVGLGDTMGQLALSPEWMLREDPEHQLGAVTAAIARELKQAVYRDPLVGHPKYGDDPAHGIVEGRKKGSRANAFVDACELMVLQPEALKPELRARLDETS